MRDKEKSKKRRREREREREVECFDARERKIDTRWERWANAAAFSEACNNTPPGVDAMLNFNINYKYLSAQQGNNLTITLAPSTVFNAKWG